MLQERKVNKSTQQQEENYKLLQKSQDSKEHRFYKKERKKEKPVSLAYVYAWLLNYSQIKGRTSDNLPYFKLYCLLEFQYRKRKSIFRGILKSLDLLLLNYFMEMVHYDH